MKKTLKYLRNQKEIGQKIIALTSYDYPTTLMLEEAGVDLLILGDSVGTNILGYKDETEVTMDDMIHHTKAICRGKRNIFVVVDLPYKTHETPEQAVENAKKLIEIGADAVKFEGIKTDILQGLKSNNINVMCHIGLNPQYDQERMRQGKIAKGKLFEEAAELFEGAKRLENAGADLIIFEKIPEKISRIITQNVEMPTIGIGAGKYCDGQVLVINDLLGISERSFKHVPKYADMREIIISIIERYRQETRNGDFPNENHINKIKPDEYDKFENWCLQNSYIV